MPKPRFRYNPKAKHAEGEIVAPLDKYNADLARREKLRRDLANYTPDPKPELEGNEA